MLKKLFLTLSIGISMGQTQEITVQDKFFNKMAPIIAAVNQTIYVERNHLNAWANQYPLKPTSEIAALQKKYQVNCDITQKKCLLELKKRVDVVPNSLALGQAALESGFGTSRFAKEGNAFFGQWCFKKGCGIQPKSPNLALGYYAVKRFSSPKAAAEEYIHNLNTQTSYEAFRALRSSQRKHEIKLNSIKLADTLNLYSTSGDKYLRDIKSIIKTYQLQKYDNAKYSSTAQNHFFA